VVLLSGDVDLDTAPRIEAFVAMQSLTGCTLLEVDLGGVPSMGSMGPPALLGLRRWCLLRGIELRVCGAQPSVWRVFEAMGLDGIFAPSTIPAEHRPAQQLALF
jgi:anti-sigma B factor antagonist